MRSTVCNQQIRRRGWEQVGKCGENHHHQQQQQRDGKKQRESKAESIMYLNQSISWYSCLLLWSLRMKTWFSSHCWGTQWTSITVPCECCWGTCHCESLFLLSSPSSALCTLLSGWLQLWQQRFFWNDADVNACKDTSSLSALPLHSHTVTAEMEQEAVRNRTRTAVSTGS